MNEDGLTESELTAFWEDVYLIKEQPLLAERLRTAQLIESQPSIKLRFITNSDEEALNAHKQQQKRTKPAARLLKLSVFMPYAEWLHTGHEYLMREFMIDSL